MFELSTKVIIIAIIDNKTTDKSYLNYVSELHGIN